MGLCPVAQCACERDVQIHLDYISLTRSTTPLHHALHSDDEREPEDLDPGTLCVLKYRPVSSLVQSGAIRLI